MKPSNSMAMIAAMAAVTGFDLNSLLPRKRVRAMESRPEEEVNRLKEAAEAKRKRKAEKRAKQHKGF